MMRKPITGALVAALAALPVVCAAPAAVWTPIGFAVALGWSALAGAAERRLPSSQAEVKLSFAPLVKGAAPAVVNVYTRKMARGRRTSPLFDDPFFRRFFGESFGFDLGPSRSERQNSLGSGVIVSADGMIVTNHHVVEGADEIRVVLADRREFAAAVVGSDERTDLAVLRVDPGPAKLPFLELRDSDEVEVGDLVLAIGNPFGVGQTVTSGIVSAVAQTRVGVSDLNFFIQTDAAINPGNSGGALVAMDGRLVGINTAIFSKTGGSHGIGFAIPSNMVRAVLAGLGAGGRVVRPWLGAWGDSVGSDVAASLGLARPSGLLIKDVYPGASAAQAGLKAGDVLLTVNGHEVNDPESLKYRIATLAVGDRAALEVWRRGRKQSLEVRLAAAPEDPPRATAELEGPHPLAGATVDNLSPALAEQLGLEPRRPGVIILEMRAGSPASRLRFRVGDVVESVNDRQVRTVADLKASLGARADEWRFVLDRRGQPFKLVVGR
jgi:serine protease Do